MEEKICQVCEETIVSIWCEDQRIGERCGCGIWDYAEGWLVDMDDDGEDGRSS